jgi:hypothetical protein
MLLDPETLELVQRADTVLEGRPRRRVRGAHDLRALPVRDRGADSDLRNGRRRGGRAAAAAQPPGDGRSRARSPTRFRRHTSLCTLRGPGRHRSDPLPRDRRAGAVPGPSRAGVWVARSCRRARPGGGDPGRPRTALADPRTDCTFGQLALLARPAERTAIDSAQRLSPFSRSILSLSFTSVSCRNSSAAVFSEVVNGPVGGRRPPRKRSRSTRRRFMQRAYRAYGSA